MKLFSLIIFLFSFSGFAQEQTLFDILHKFQQNSNYGNSTLTNTRETNFIDGPNALTLGTVKKVFWIASGRHVWPISPTITASQGGYGGYSFVKLEEEYYDIAYSLVKNGFAKKKHFDDVFLVKYAYIKTLSPPSSDDCDSNCRKDWYWGKIRWAFYEYTNAIQADPLQCANEGVIAGNRQCCDIDSYGLLKLPFVRKTSQQCIPIGTCGDHRDCCSGVCRRDDQNTTGTCAPENLLLTGEECEQDEQCLSESCQKEFGQTKGNCSPLMQCYSLIPLDGNCTDERPYCGEGDCYTIDKGSLGGNLCKRDGDTCSNNDDCCSDKCDGATNKCIKNAICKRCVGSGAEPKPGQECCPGFYKSGETGKCRHMYNPQVPICLHKDGPCSEGSQCCSQQCGANNKCTFFDKDELRNQKLERIKAKFKKTLMAATLSVLNIIIPSAHAASGCDNGTSLTTAQQNQLDLMERACVDDPDPDDCQRRIDEQLQVYCRDNVTPLTEEQQAQIDQARAKCIENYPIPPSSNEEARAECMQVVLQMERDFQAQGANTSGDNRYEDYINQYNAPPVTAKTYSNIRNCDFHSFNDLWKDAGNGERNAELFIRSFEFVFVAEGTQDYWQEGDIGNVFKRSNDAAIRLRKARKNLIDAAKEVDRKSECYCVGVFGPEKFSQEKKDRFFGQTCADIRGLIGQNFATGEQTTSGMDGTGLESTNSNTQDQAKMETVDKGALGISYMLALIAYTEFNQGLMIDRFEDNIEIENDMLKMSEFLVNTNFEESWRPTVHGSGTSAYIQPNQNDKTPGVITSTSNIINEPQNYVRLYKWGFRYWNTFMSIIWTVLTIGLANIGGHLFQSGDSAATQNNNNNSLKAAFGKTADQWPRVYDLMKYDNSQWNNGWGKKWDGFERYYLGPEYSNESSVAETKCHVMARASACLRVAYAFSPGTLKYLEGFPDAGHYILDPKRPPYITATDLEIQNMPGQGKPYTQIINEAVGKGIQYLDNSTEPDDLGYSYKTKDDFPDYKVTKAGSDYRDEQVMQKAFQAGKFAPFSNNYNPPTFGNTLKNKIVDAAVKYAMCKELSSEGCTGVSGAQDGDLGFGYLFENEAEARAWAEYTYEMHYVYSSVTSNDYMGYPLLGSNYYFETLAHKISLLDSIFAQRIVERQNLLNLLRSDLEKRINDYTSLGQLYNGTKSKNLKYGPKVFEAFAQLNFGGMSSIEAFDQIIDSAKKDPNITSGDLTAINAIKNKALNTNKAISSVQDYIKGSDNLKNGVDIEKLDSNQKKLINPIAAISTVNGSKFGKNGFLDNNQLKDIKDQLANINKQLNAKPKIPEYKSAFDGNIPMPSYGGGSSSSNYNSSSSTDSTNSNGQGMSTSEANSLIKQLKNNKELTERLEGDTLFTIVSKAYKRNYSRVLYRTSKSSKIVKEKEVTDKEKEELKKILDGGK